MFFPALLLLRLLVFQIGNESDPFFRDEKNVCLFGPIYPVFPLTTTTVVTLALNRPECT